MIHEGHSTDLPTCEVLYGLVRMSRPVVCVEAGTFMGASAYYIGKALDANDLGHLATADPVDHGGLPPDMSERVTYWQMDFGRMLEKMGAQIDFAFIDASSDAADGAKLRWLHFQLALDCLRPGGIVCVHDTAADDWLDGEGGRSANRIRESCGLNLTSQRGLSIYQG